MAGGSAAASGSAGTVTISGSGALALTSTTVVNVSAIGTTVLTSGAVYMMGNGGDNGGGKNAKHSKKISIQLHRG